MCIPQAAVELPRPRLPDGRRSIIGDDRSMDPVLRTEDELTPWIEDDSLPRVKAGSAGLGGDLLADPCGGGGDRARCAVQAPDDDIVRPFGFPEMLKL